MRSMRPPECDAGNVDSGIVKSPISRKSHPPLLHTYNAPSGPTPRPFGLPPGSATVSLRPSGCTRLIRPPFSTVHSTVPSAIQTGPSGNWSPDVISSNAGWLIRRSLHPPERGARAPVTAAASEEQRTRRRREVAGADAVVGHLRDGDHRDAVLLGKQLEVRAPRRRAVVVQHFANHRDRRQTREPGEVDRGLGVTASFEHAAFAGAQREHVTGPDEVV